MERRRSTDVIVETIAPRGKHVIDVGCGDGKLVRHLTENGAHVLGVECNPRQLSKANAAERIGDERIIDGVGQALPAPNGSADVVVFFNSLHHIPVEFMGKALAEAARVLVPGGFAYVQEPLPEGLFFQTVLPIDDETAVRGAALAAIRSAGSVGLIEDTEITFIHTFRMDSYEAFRGMVISANTEREALFDQKDAEMRALFARNAHPASDGGYAFDQPMRVNILRKPKAL